MTDKIHFFTTEQGNLLIRLVIAHLLSDFLFQTKQMVDNKKWFSLEMGKHCVIIYLLTAFLTGWWLMAFVITLSHYIIDGVKIELQERNLGKTWQLFTLDQLFHISILILLWAYQLNITPNLLKTLTYLTTDYSISLLVIGYLLVSSPTGFFIKFILKSITTDTANEAGNSMETSQEQGGTFIGIFERVIILTFVLLNQFEAIGFLITGKSIIRFANKNEHIKSEYVLVGTMMSYCIAIVVGVLINYLLAAQ